MRTSGIFRNPQRKQQRVIKMKDFVLAEKCRFCGVHLTLMGSVSADGGHWLVKRCLKCGQPGPVEVCQLADGQL